MAFLSDVEQQVITDLETATGDGLTMYRGEELAVVDLIPKYSCGLTKQELRGAGGKRFILWDRYRKSADT